MSAFTAAVYLVQVKAHGHIAHVHKEVLFIKTKHVDKKKKKKHIKMLQQMSVNKEYDTITARHYKVSSLFSVGSLFLSTLQLN